MPLTPVQIVGSQPTSCGLFIKLPDVRTMLSENTASELRQLLLAHGLLVIRAVPLTPNQQVAFSRGFGTVEVLPWQPSQLREHPEIFRVSNCSDHGLKDVGHSWHSDGTYLKHPREISIFHIVTVPEQGGETQFASLHAAYDAASPILRHQLADKEAAFDTGVTHPIIRTHPVTGRMGFYVKLGKSRRMQGVTSAEGEALFSEIESLLNRYGNVYTHVWQEGDVVIADNFSVAHRANKPPENTLRVLHRTSIVGGCRTVD